LEKEYPADYQGREDASHFYYLCKTLKKLGYEVIHYNLDVENVSSLRDVKFDLAFNLCDDGFDNKAYLEPHVPAIFDIYNIKYTGSNYYTLATCLDKIRTKEILLFHGIRTARFQTFSTGNEILNKSLKFPLIVKPAKEDASIGLRFDSVVQNERELRKKVRDVVRRYDQDALVEEYIDGREINIGIVGSKDPVILPVAEICFDNFPENMPKILTYDAKWDKETFEYKNTRNKCPTQVDPAIEMEMKEMALKAFKLMGCQDYARIDIRLDSNNVPYILEVNPNPDLSVDAGFSHMIKAAGKTYTDLIEMIIDSAVERYNIAEEPAAEFIGKKVKAKVSVRA
jgi:D-alanine-D-alanine ligase